MNVSVIIPVYKVEKFIERCIRSVMNQSYTEEVECIVVDDCTPDQSMRIVERMVAGYEGPIRFKLLYHKCNRGLAAVRNTGLDAATGDYILHLDSDDYFEPDMLEKMYGKAVAEDADIVVADYWVTYESKEVYHSQYVPEKSVDALKSLLCLKLKGFNCNKLFRHALYTENQLRYEEGINMGEDLLMCLQMFFYARKIVGVSHAFLHYVQYNANSYSHTSSVESLKCLIYIEDFLIRFFEQHGMSGILRKEMIGRQLLFQKSLLFNSKGKLQREWNSRYRHITPFMVVRYGSSVSLYWRVALLFASLHVLPGFNLMRRFWGIMRPGLWRNTILYDKV